MNAYTETKETGGTMATIELTGRKMSWLWAVLRNCT